MQYSILDRLITSAFVLAFACSPLYADDASPALTTPASVETLDTVTVQGINNARTQIETQTGASTYTIDSSAIAAAPAGDNTLLNQVILQAPEAAQDSFGQLHIRGEHNGLQYRLNGIILPEGINVFGQTLDPRMISSMQLITGALPAEYGLRTAGIIDLTTKNGALEPGGAISLYGGSHDTIEPSFNYGSSSGNINYFVSGDFLSNDLGIESPDGRSDPLHDHTTQDHGFGYFQDILDDHNSMSLMLGTSRGQFEIPNQKGLEPLLGLNVDGQTIFPSQNLNENQREITQYGIVSFLRSQGKLDLQTSLISRYSSLDFSPDILGDLLYDGISQHAYKRDIAYGLQTDGDYRLDDAHTLRAGIYLQHDRTTSDTASEILPTDSDGNQTSDVPVSISDNGAKAQWIESIYLQDEWRLLSVLTINYGARFDNFTAYDHGHQLSPRFNVVWQPLQGTTVHTGYARYFSPPPFELVGSETVSKFQDTTAAASVSQADTPKAEQANYFDLGVQQKVTEGLTTGIDTYYKESRELIDEGQFGAPIILTPFNYLHGKQFGGEFTANYTSGLFSTYGNLAFQSARGKDITSAQFNFSQDDLNYISDHYIDLDHEQRMTASGGVSYLCYGTRYSADLLIGSGLRADLVKPDGTAVPNGEHLPYYEQVNLGINHVYHLSKVSTLAARFDVINVFDKKYEIRNGTGVGVGAPQFGPRRGLFFGLSKSL